MQEILQIEDHNAERTDVRTLPLTPTYIGGAACPSGVSLVPSNGLNSSIVNSFSVLGGGTTYENGPGNKVCQAVETGK